MANRFFCVCFLIASVFPSIASAQFSDNFDSENGGSGVFNFTDFINFEVTNGSVDLIGNGFFDFFPGNGLFLDLNGTTGVSGSIASLIDIEPGSHLLSFRLGNHPDIPAENSVLVSLGNYSETFTRAGGVPLELVERTVVVTAPSRLSFSTPGSDSDLGGILLDSISVVLISEPAILGDVNLDGAVNFSDIPAFIAVLQSGEFQGEADVDQNGTVNFSDIPAFITILSNQ